MAHEYFELTGIGYVNAWIKLKKEDGFVQSLFEHWILGRNAARKQPRCPVASEVLHWVD